MFIWIAKIPSPALGRPRPAPATRRARTLRHRELLFHWLRHLRHNHFGVLLEFHPFHVAVATALDLQSDRLIRLSTFAAAGLSEFAPLSPDFLQPSMARAASANGKNGEGGFMVR